MDMSRFLQYIDECETCGCGDPDKVHKKKKKKKKVEEGLNEASSNVHGVADNFARLIMGDMNVAFRNLKKSLPLDQATFQPGKEYNDAFIKLVGDFEMAINKALKAAK
jgi:hypothetical protein